MHTPLINGLSESQMNAFSAVLASANVPFRSQKSRGEWSIHVEDAHVEHARHILSEYLYENQPVDTAVDTVDEPSTKTLSGVWAGGMLAAVYIAAGRGKNLDVFIKSFGSSASEIVEGDFYRTATSLFFHGDAGHLVGNMVCIALFGTAVCGITGWGVGWLMILFGGMSGNLLNAFFYQSGHISIGASTAVFGAVGILSGYQFMNRAKRSGQSGWRKSAWLPIACGLALLAFLGAGEYTDIMAHLFGFMSGLLLGVGYAAIIRRPLSSVFQYISVSIVLGVLTLSWIQGLG